MKKMIVALAAFTLASCADKKNDATTKVNSAKAELSDAQWLLGRWENQSEEGIMTETWTRESDSSFAAKTYFITDGDTAFSESVRLVGRNGSLVYIAKAMGQNDDKPVEFGLTAADGKTMTFENPAHDYPEKIVYENYGDSLKAWISGHKLGVESKEEFPLKKVK